MSSSREFKGKPWITLSINLNFHSWLGEIRSSDAEIEAKVSSENIKKIFPANEFATLFSSIGLV